MSIPIIRRALEKRLAALTPAIATSYENVAFQTISGVPYQRANLLPAAPDDSIAGGFSYFERGIFQILLCYPYSTGPAAVEAQAHLTRVWFKSGTTLLESGVLVQLIGAPKPGPAYVEGDRFCTPISVRYQALVTPN